MNGCVAVFLCTRVGSPFKFNVTDLNRVSAKGRGLSSVVCRQPASFTVSTPSGAAAGTALKQKDLDINIVGQSVTFLSSTKSSWSCRVLLLLNVANKYRRECVQCHYTVA